MAKILVHLHLFYHDQTDYFIDKLSNINGVEWDLRVTYSRWDDDAMKKLSQFKPDTEFIKVRNFGYDIWPFIQLIKNTDLSKYDFAIKLHTKRSIGCCRPNIIKLRGAGWRNALVDGILCSKEHFGKVMAKFEKEPATGMISSLLTYAKRDYHREQVLQELERLGLTKNEKHTCMGSMFIVRTKPLEFLKSDLITEEMFKDEPSVSGTFFQHAHLYERILCQLPINAGMRHKPISPLRKDLVKIKINNAIKPVGKFFFTCEREGPQHKKVVRVFRIKVREKNDLANHA